MSTITHDGAPFDAGGETPVWSPVPSKTPGGDPASRARDLARNDHYSRPDALTPPYLVTRIGASTTALLSLCQASALLLFSPVVLPDMLPLLERMPAWIAVAGALAVLAMVVAGILAVWPLRAIGFKGLPLVGGPHSDEEDARIEERLRRVLPCTRALLWTLRLQIALFLLTHIGIIVTLALAGELNNADRAVSAAQTGWACIEVGIIMAAFRGRAQLLVLAVGAIVSMLFQGLVPAGSGTELLLSVCEPLLLGLVVYGAQRFGVETAQLSGMMSRDRRVRSRAAAVLDAAVTEAGRIEDLIHDNILSCLLLTSRGGAEDEWASRAIKQHAAAAVRALDEIADPSPAPALTPVSAETFTRKLTEQVRAVGARLTIVTRGRRRRPIPAEVAHTLLAAAAEAVRNSVRHADGDLLRGDVPVRRQVSLALTDESIALEIVDNGVGFDPAGLPPRSIGLRDEILRRVQQLPGGHAGVASAPMAGTAVQLHWQDQDPAATKDQASSIDGELDTSGFRLRDQTMSGLFAAGLTLLSIIAVLTLPAFEHWVYPFLALVLTFVLAYVLSHDWGTPTGAPPAWMWPYTGLVPPLLVGLGLLGTDGGEAHPSGTWIETAVLIVLVVLSMSRYYAGAWIGAISASVLSILWAVATDHPEAPFAGLWPLYLAVVLFCTVMGSWTQHRIEDSAQLQREREQTVARHLQQAEVLRQRQARSAELDVVVRPLITRLAGDEPVTADIELEAGLLEARLRDDMRARCFHGTDVSRAAWDARGRGVFVELLDDGGLASASGALQEAVVSHVAEHLDGMTCGQVTVRVLPADRDVVATVLCRPEGEAQTRTEILEDGSARSRTT